MSVDFINRSPSSPNSILELIFKDEGGVEYKSKHFMRGELVHLNLDTSVHFALSYCIVVVRS